MMNLNLNKYIKKRIVICGSMSFYSDMAGLARRLNEVGISTVLPDSDDPFVDSISPEDFRNVKRVVSMRHIRRIRDNEKTFGILVVNRDKHGIPDYIGPNTFAEVAIAIAHYKPVYLYQNIPKFYKDELNAWQVINLNGDLSQLIQDYKATNSVECLQLNLFGESEEE